MKTITTLKASMTFGINEGYFHNNENSSNIDLIAETIKKISDKIMKKTNLYITGSLEEVRTIYATNWGCPTGGEKCYKFESVANPKFVKDIDEFKNAFIEFTQEIKTEYKQSTIMIDFTNVDCLYLN